MVLLAAGASFFLQLMMVPTQSVMEKRKMNGRLIGLVENRGVAGMDLILLM